jgi:hypothetical protein
MTLPRAQVSNWGQLISTPDASLQETVRGALTAAGCPSNYSDELISRAHELRWPRGLEDMDQRLSNREILNNFICRRVPGKHAVIVMPQENKHMNEFMVLDHELVFIFKSGIESL